MRLSWPRAAAALVACLVSGHARAQPGDVDRLVAALLSDTPLIRDLQSLSDEIGGRATGSAANLKSVDWALERFADARVPARKEAFQMPTLWLERGSRAWVGGGASFAPRVVAMPFSAAIAAGAAPAPLLDAGAGSVADFARLGARARGAFALIETAPLADLEGLFREYAEAAAIEKRAFAAGVQGVVYMSSRPNTLLYRHNASLGPDNRHPLLVMEREDALRALRLLRGGKALTLTVQIDLQSGGPYESFNVIGEIRGRERPDEFVLIGAHLDSWDLGTGALDNGCNVALVLDVARQIQALGLAPRRTIRFALWNGEEQGMLGSWAYARDHAGELDRHVMAASFDIGSGRIAGFFTNGRKEALAAVERALVPVAGLGPFAHVEEPVVGTDNLDFMLEGVLNLVANQESANYGPNYHAASDTFDKVDQRQLRVNAAVAAAVAWGFAETDASWKRQGRAEIEALVEGTSLRAQLESFGLYELWRSGARGRKPE
jgi:hypothetical protein